MASALGVVLRRGLGWSPYLMIAFAARCFSALNMFILMGELPPAEFAHFAYFQVSTGYIGGFALLGLDASSNVLLSRARSENKSQNIVYFSSIAIALASVILLLPLLNFVYNGLRSGAAGMLTESLVAECAFVLQGVTGGLLAGRALNVHSAAISAIVSAGFCVLCVVSRLDVPALITGYIVFQWLGVGLNFATYAFVGNGGFAFERPRIPIVESLALFGFKSASASLAVNMVQLSLQTRMLSRQGTATIENAKYTFAGQIYNALIFAPVILAPILINRIAKKANERERWEACLKLAALFFAVSGVGLALVLGCVRIVVQFLPRVYSTAEVSVTLNALAALCGFVKSPLSIYFVASMRMLPDFTAAIVASLVGLATIALGSVVTAEAGSEIRLLVQGLQLMIVLSFFLSGKPQRVEGVNYRV